MLYLLEMSPSEGLSHIHIQTHTKGLELESTFAAEMSQCSFHAAFGNAMELVSSWHLISKCNLTSSFSLSNQTKCPVYRHVCRLTDFPDTASIVV